jgi:peptidyl-prolyl cis-trans isomerase C
VRPLASIPHHIRPIFGSVLACLLWALTGCPSSAPELPVLAVVNGKPISRNEFDHRWAELSPALRDHYARAGGQGRFLDDLISRELLVQEARRRGVDQNPALRDRIETMKEQMLVDDLLHQGLGQPVEITEAELDAYVSRHRELMPPDSEIHAAHIVVESSAVARQVKRQLDRGARFETLATRFSTDKATRAQGGALGVYRPGSADPEVEAAILSLKPGMISEPIKTEAGYRLIKVLRRDSPDPKVVQAAREQLRGELRAEKRLRQYADFVAQLRAHAVIRKEG